MVNTDMKSFIETAKIVTNVANHARDNQSFKERLIAAPHATINEYAGEKEIFTSSTNIVVTEPNKDEVYFFIPRKVDIGDLELSDLELEDISGGSDFIVGVGLGLLAVGIGWGLAQL